MPMLTLRQLRYLDALARHRHFGRAAEECAVSQPALSMQLRELEQSLGAQLIDRRRVAAALTAILGPSGCASRRATSTRATWFCSRKFTACATRRSPIAPRRNAIRTTGLGATSLATIMQMVASGYGVTLVPEVAVDVEVRDDRVK